MAKKATSGSAAMNNPFLDPKLNPFMDPERNPFLKSDFSSMFKGFEAPDMQVFTDAQRKNMEALTTANKTAVEGMQAVMQRQSEIMKEAMDEANAALQELQTKGAGSPDASAQIDQLKSAIETVVANTKEVSEMMAKSQSEAFDIVNQRFLESMEELKGAMGQTGTK